MQNKDLLGISVWELIDTYVMLTDDWGTFIGLVDYNMLENFLKEQDDEFLDYFNDLFSVSDLLPCVQDGKVLSIEDLIKIRKEIE